MESNELNGRPKGHGQPDLDPAAGSKASVPSLQVHSERENILDQVDSNSVTVISGPTGCGKTTLIPQFILQQNEKRRTGVKIIVTQPRRIAAQSVARRVAHNLGVRIGTVVGYKIGLDKENCSFDTQIIYCTTGILKKIIIQKRCLTDFTHIILDEVHDRSQDMDFLLLLCKQFIRTNSRGVKLILMSATLDCGKLLDYFYGASYHEIKTSTVFPITEYFLDDFTETVQDTDPCVQNNTVDACIKIIRQLGAPQVDRGGAVLVFLPGEAEIKIVKDALEVNDEHKKNNWWIVFLHSRVPLEESQDVFRNKPGFRKIVLSTNMAESSVTIPDVEVVIDFCLTKNIKSDPATNYIKLKLEWADGNSSTQRRGRCGRTCPGKLYRLVTRDFFSKSIQNVRHSPEILRAPLEKVVLDAKQLGLGTPKEILALAMDPPKLENLSVAIRLLKEIGAVLVTATGKETEDDGDLTVLGEILSILPIDVRLGKLVVLGFLLGVLEETIIIAAGLSSKTIFTSSFSDRLKGYSQKFTWANDTFSDCLAILKAYSTWKDHKINNFFLRDVGGQDAAEKVWCRSRYLEIKALREAEALIDEIKTYLNKLKILEHALPNYQTESETLFYVQIAIFGAFYPNYLNRAGSKMDPKELSRLCDCYPHETTIHLRGMTQEQATCAVLYENQIKDIFSEICCCHPNSIKVGYSETKIFLTFDSDVLFSNPKYSDQVYFALKSRRLRRPEIQIKAYPDDVARKVIGSLKMAEEESQGVSEKDLVDFETIGQVELSISSFGSQMLFITNVENPNSFWVRRFIDGEKWKVLVASVEALRARNTGTFAKRSFDLKKNVLCLTEYDGSLYRARPIEANSLRLVTVRLIDLGTLATIDINKVRILTCEEVKEFPEILTIPALAINCSLACVKPNEARQNHAKDFWDHQSIMAFKNMLEFRGLGDTVWANVMGLFEKDFGKLVYVEVFLSPDKSESLNEKYLEKCDAEGTPFGVKGSDPQLSLSSKDFLSKIETLKKPHVIDEKNATVTITLRGPFHPLETHLTAVTSLGSTREVRIEQDSVNSIFIDRFPLSSIDQWVVCSLLTTNERGNIITGRSTTCMPMIRGLGPILTMVFAPKVELRVDNKRQRYTGCIAGLGSRKIFSLTKFDESSNSSVPYYHPHDIEITFDVFFDNADIENINKIRCIISEWLSRPSDVTSNLAQEVVPNYVDEQKCIENTLSLRHLLNTVMNKNRLLKPKESTPHLYKWDKLPNSDHLVDLYTPNNDENFLSTFKGVIIGFDQFVKLKSQVSSLKRLERVIRRKEIVNQTIPCPICAASIISMSPAALINHFQSTEHQKNKHELGRTICDLF